MPLVPPYPPSIAAASIPVSDLHSVLSQALRPTDADTVAPYPLPHTCTVLPGPWPPTLVLDASEVRGVS
eukprot:498893-Hanusia_phi.AAC.2